MDENQGLKMLKCFLCEKKGISVKKFNEERLEKCRKIHAFRKNKNLKHLDAILPVLSVQLSGYHIQCYDKFIMLKSNNRKEFDSMLGNGKVLIKNIPPLKIDSRNAFKKTRKSTSIGIEIPKLIQIPEIGTKTFDIDLKVTSTPYGMDEPSYVNPDISRGVILKSILTRKSPIKKDMLNNPIAFDSGMDLLRYGMFNQANFNFSDGKFSLKTQTNALNDCLFCGKEQRTLGSQVDLLQILKVDQYKMVLQTAEALEDKTLLVKLLRSNNMCSSHDLCRIEYKNRQEKITSKNCDEDEKVVLKNLQLKAFQAISAFIQDQIVVRNKAFFLTDLFERYKAILNDIQNSTTLEIEFPNVQNIQEELLKQFEGSIKITMKAKRRIVHKDGTTDLDTASVENENFKNDKVAFELRSEIISLKRKSASKNDEEIPEKLLRLVTSLIQGPYVSNSCDDSVKIKAFCQHIVKKINKD